MAKKYIIQGQPNYTDASQYNFSDNENTFNYDNSTGLPKNNDKFKNKDLYTNAKGDKLNNAIINGNLKFEGESFIRIERLRVVNAGVSYPIRDIDIRGYIFSHAQFQAFKSNGSIKSYDDVDNMPSYSRFFKYTPGDVAEGNDVGNLTFLEGVNILENLGVDENLTLGNFTNREDNFNGLDLEVDDEDRADRNVFDLEDSTTVTSIFEENTFNPIYFAFFLKGDADRSWGRDRRKRRFQIFRIDSRDFLNMEDDVYTGTQVTFDDLSGQSTTGNGGSGAAESAALKISDFSITVNTIVGQVNSQNVIDAYAEFIPNVLSPTLFEQTNLKTFLRQSPNRQLNNSINSAVQSSLQDTFPDYFPKTLFGTADKDGILNSGDNLVDLQSYYEDDMVKSLQASAPATITFDLQMVDPIDDTMETFVEGSYFYFVASWNDIDNDLRDLERYQDKSPTNLIELLEQQNENLYIIKKIQQSADGTIVTDTPSLKNTYNTPGIKTIKIVVFSYDEETNQVGRWKLIKCRFFLDIPRSEFPDFGELGGEDYKIIPWPNTTAVIGGVNNKSKYKTSVQKAISSGNIGDTDIIDEKFLTQDLENDELGQSIDKMDLEQVRLFNKNYSINSLLQIESSPFYTYDSVNADGTLYWDGIDNKFPMESSVGQIFINDNIDLNLIKSCQLELNTGNLSGKSIYDSSGNVNKGLIIGDYNVKKTEKGRSMRRDSFIKVPKKTSNRDGAL